LYVRKKSTEQSKHYWSNKKKKGLAQGWVLTKPRKGKRGKPGENDFEKRTGKVRSGFAT